MSFSHRPRFDKKEAAITMNATSLTDSNNNSKEVINQPSESREQDIVVPGVNDVIIGRGIHKNQNQGNRDLKCLLEANHEKFEASSPFQKRYLLKFIVSKMINNGSRFLLRKGTKKDGMWVEISDEEAQTKVANRFQQVRRRARERIANNCWATIFSINKECLMNHNSDDDGSSNNRATITTDNSDDPRVVVTDCDDPAAMQQPGGMVRGLNYLPQQLIMHSLHLNAIQVLHQLIAWRLKTKHAEQQLRMTPCCNDDTNEEARP